MEKMAFAGLNTLWIYTTLKPFTPCGVPFFVWIPSGFTPLSNPQITLCSQVLVWIPSGFTPLSNYFNFCSFQFYVWIPSGFTPLSNRLILPTDCILFEYPLDLHHSQTGIRWRSRKLRFEYPLDLHHSQTFPGVSNRLGKFEYPLDLHHSQTHRM